jgi:hypothetical protein
MSIDATRNFAGEKVLDRPAHRESASSLTSARRPILQHPAAQMITIAVQISIARIKRAR